MSARSDLELIPARWEGLSTGLSLFSLGLLVWGVTSQLGRVGTGDAGPVAVTLLVVAGVTWVVGMVLRPDDSAVSGAAIGVMALTGGALIAFTPIAMVFPAVAVLSAAIRWRLEIWAAVAAGGWLAGFVSVLATGKSFGVSLGCLAAILGGSLVGIARRQAGERAEQMARTEVETVRAEVERERAELLSERNHLAREIHDVLAHTLAALSLQLEAFGTIVESEPDTSPAVRTQLERTRRLVHEGLDEARGAVQALRDDAAPLDEQLRTLCAQHNAAFASSGESSPLPPPVVVNLYRVTQEALTNVMKHATGAPVSVLLSFGGDEVSVEIDNECTGTPPALHETGGGYGLRGIAERLALLNGRMEAGPTPGGWRVSATAPLDGSGPFPRDRQLP